MASRLLIRNFSGKVNYYEVLGILPSAKPEEVKLAYRDLVKKMHPDVAGANASQEKFRLITEAYTVLSKLETRATYDLTQSSKSEIEAILDRKRDKTGLSIPKPQYALHEYGYKRLKELSEERKKYNINDFYRYRGGLPQKHLGSIRGEAYGAPDTKADVHSLNFILKLHGSIPFESDYVDNKEAHEYKLSKTIDTDNLKAQKPFLRAEIDYNYTKFYTFRRHFLFYAALAGLIALGRLSYEISKARLQFIIKKIKHNAEASAKSYERAGMRAVSLS
jgi:curved DNA-binding protein CbpA